MPPDLPRPTDAELRLLDELWRDGPCTVRELAIRLHGEPTNVQYRTVQVQLDRLVKKGLVAKDRGASPQRFAAAVDRARFIGSELQSMADRVCDGSLAPLLLNLAGQAKLSDAEKAELRRLLGDDDEDDDQDDGEDGGDD